MPTAVPISAGDPAKSDRTLSVRLTAEEHQRIHDLAWERRSTASALAREALRRSLPLTADDPEPAAT